MFSSHPMDLSSVVEKGFSRHSVFGKVIPINGEGTGSLSNRLINFTHFALQNREEKAARIPKSHGAATA